MGRLLPRPLSDVGSRIYSRMRELDLKPPEIAAAAGVSPSTLYRIMKGSKDGPRLRTKRMLAKALRVPMAQLFDEPQLEILDQHEPPLDREPSRLELLILHQFRTVKPSFRRHAARAAVFALVDMILGVSSELNDDQLQLLSVAKAEDHFHKLLPTLFRLLPPKVRRTGAKMAISAMVNVEMAANRVPSEPLYRAMNRTNWSAKRMRRDRPPLEWPHAG